MITNLPSQPITVILKKDDILEGKTEEIQKQFYQQLFDLKNNEKYRQIVKEIIKEIDIMKEQSELRVQKLNLLKPNILLEFALVLLIFNFIIYFVNQQFDIFSVICKLITIDEVILIEIMIMIIYFIFKYNINEYEIDKFIKQKDYQTQQQQKIIDLIMQQKQILNEYLIFYQKNKEILFTLPEQSPQKSYLLLQSIIKQCNQQMKKVKNLQLDQSEISKNGQQSDDDSTEEFSFDSQNEKVITTDNTPKSSEIKKKPLCKKNSNEQANQLKDQQEQKQQSSSIKDGKNHNKIKQRYDYDSQQRLKQEKGNQIQQIIKSKKQKQAQQNNYGQKFWSFLNQALELFSDIKLKIQQKFCYQFNKMEDQKAQNYNLQFYQQQNQLKEQIKKFQFNNDQFII